MRPDRREQVEQLYYAARARADGERSAFLDGACAGDAALQREVESLLARQTPAADGLRDRPARAASLLNEPSRAPGVGGSTRRRPRPLARWRRGRKSARHP